VLSRRKGILYIAKIVNENINNLHYIWKTETLFVTYLLIYLVDHMMFIFIPH